MKESKTKKKVQAPKQSAFKPSLKGLSGAAQPKSKGN
jgi:hypothetical protein